VLTGSGRVRAAVGLAIALALSVAGCGGHSSASPQNLPPLSVPTASPSALTKATPPTVGRAVTGLSAATAVVRRYFVIVNNLHRDMDAGALAALFTATCVCQEQAKAVRSASRLGQHYIDHGTINALRTSDQGPGHVGVLADYNSSSGGLVDRHGRRITTTTAKRVRWFFSLRRLESRWLITNIQDIS
jgi:hypothetical protein